MKRLLTMVGCLALFSVCANASIIYNYTGTTVNGVNFDWGYDASLSADQKIDSTTFANFAVLFDFGTAAQIVGVSYTGVQAGIAAATVLELISPQPVGTASTDSG